MIVLHSPPSLMSRLIWHRRDLRLRDNELYHHSCCVYSLFIFNPSDFAPRPTGIFHDGCSSSENELLGITHGPHYTRRLINAVHSLRHKLRSLGGELIVRIGNPLLIIPSLLDNELHNVVNEVAWSEISGYYECIESKKLKDTTTSQWSTTVQGVYNMFSYSIPS